jgi:uncharacterized protein (DUF1919 family)
VEKPVVITPNTGRDFGSGFYLTSIREQAEKWAYRQAKIRKQKNAYLNCYDFDEYSVVSQLNVKKFDNYSMEWLELVIACRRNENYKHDYDIVFGKIADDDVGETVQAVIDDLTPKDFALQKLSFLTANDQY